MNRALEDIRDVHDFSAAVVNRSMAKRMLPEEVEEAICEGVAILYELHAKWDPEKTPSFYRWCTTMLQFRLISWWRREMRQRVLAHQNDSCKSYTYLRRVSLDERQEYEMAGGRPETERTRADRALTTVDAGRVGD